MKNFKKYIKYIIMAVLLVVMIIFNIKKCGNKKESKAYENNITSLAAANEIDYSIQPRTSNDKTTLNFQGKISNNPYFHLNGNFTGDIYAWVYKIILNEFPKEQFTIELIQNKNVTCTYWFLFEGPSGWIDRKQIQPGHSTWNTSLFPSSYTTFSIAILGINNITYNIDSEIYFYAGGYNAQFVPIFSQGYNFGYGSEAKPGYDIGYQEGKTEGYNEGYNNGSSAGYQNGYNTGYNTGKTQGLEAGKKEGYENGYKEGYDAGNKSGYEAGYKAGYDVGHKEGYDKGYEDGGKAVYDEGYNKGLEYSQFGIFSEATYDGTFSYGPTEPYQNNVVTNQPLKPYLVNSGIDFWKFFKEVEEWEGHENLGSINAADITVNLKTPVSYANDSFSWYGGSVGITFTLIDTDGKRYSVDIDDMEGTAGDTRVKIPFPINQPTLISKINIVFRAANNTMEGVFSSNSTGYYAGVDVGYNNGLQNGKIEGYNTGYSAGFEIGKSEGYTTGYNQAVSEGLSNTNIFYGAIAMVKMFFQLITKFMETKIAGDLTLGLFVIGIPAVFMIISLVINLIKKFAGGSGGGGNNDG